MLIAFDWPKAAVTTMSTRSSPTHATAVALCSPGSAATPSPGCLPMRWCTCCSTSAKTACRSPSSRRCRGLRICAVDGSTRCGSCVWGASLSIGGCTVAIDHQMLGPAWIVRPLHGPAFIEQHDVWGRCVLVVMSACDRSLDPDSAIRWEHITAMLSVFSAH
ncbi:hypothetical protein [Aeromicrobium sp. UC242_57]|uniref:hypothetical protein n=1 Tax=Aeromicrobium sp. UC242_57 TaxID=3374624 RepID=UPI003789A7DC